MNTESITKMNETKILKLSKREIIHHYFLGIIPLSCGILHLYWILKMYDFEHFNEFKNVNEYTTSCIFWFLLALLIFIIKRRRLNFTLIVNSLNTTEFKEIILKIAEIEKWKLTTKTKNLAKYSIDSNWTWGLSITVLRFENYLLINSICDVNSRPCISIFNENERNINKLKKYLKKASG